MAVTPKRIVSVISAWNPGCSSGHRQVLTPARVSRGQVGPHRELSMFLISQSWLSANRTTDVLYGLTNSVPAILPSNDEALSGVASPSRKTTSLTTSGFFSAAIPTSAAPAE